MENRSILIIFFTIKIIVITTYSQIIFSSSDIITTGNIDDRYTSVILRNNGD